MNALTPGDWTLIARYLKDEATPADLAKIYGLMKAHPGLKAELGRLGRELADPRADGHQDGFDADAAFEKLNKRFREEGLL